MREAQMQYQDTSLAQTESLPAEVGNVKSATRVLDLFEFLGRWDVEKTHTEIAEELGIPKSSLTKLLQTLVRRGYLSYLPASKGYILGPAIAALAERNHEGQDLVSIAGALLPQITAETQETCALNLLRGDKSEVVAASMSSHRLLYSMRLGDTAPLYATSGGKALLAYLPLEMQSEYLARVKFEPFLPNTITSVARLEQELQSIRETGVAFVFEEYTAGIIGMARPVLSASGFPLASINIVVPTARYNEQARDRYTAVLAKAVTTIRQQGRLGGR
jgi:DNA-binding IclR family transcriptional regulator